MIECGVQVIKDIEKKGTQMYKEKILKPVNDKLPKVTWRDVERFELERIGGDLAEVTTNARSIHDLEQGKPGQVGGDILESVGLPRSSGELREMLLSWWNDIYDDVKCRTIGSDFPIQLYISKR